MSLSFNEDGLLDFIPKSLPTEYLATPASFSRNTKLSIQETIAFVCSLVSGGLKGGLRPNLANFLLNNETHKSVDVSTACRTRYKIRHTAFKQLFSEVVEFTYKHWNSPDSQSLGRNIIAVDGSKFDLPATNDLKKKFDPRSLNLVNGGHHYPQCLVTTFYDVLRKIPVYRTICPVVGGNERVELLESLQVLPQDSVILGDRGYWGYEVFFNIIEKSTHDCLLRMPSSGTFREIVQFVQSDKKEDILTINPPEEFMRKWRRGEGKIKTPTPIKLRVIRYTPPQGTEEIILATTLLDSEKYPSNKLTELYWDRWQVELFYRDEKCYVEAAKFRSKKEEGIFQELFASVLMAIVTRYHLYKDRLKTNVETVSQYLTSITTLSNNLVKLITLSEKKSIQFFQRVMEVVRQSKYYPQKNRASNPRVTKASRNKWKQDRQRKLKQLE